MLKQRVITALILLAVLLPALFARPLWPFAMLSIVVVAAAGWEWGRLNGLAFAPAAVMGLAIAGLCAATWWVGLAALQSAWLWWGVTAAWVLGGAYVLSRGPSMWPQWPVSLRLAIGVIVLWLTWTAMTRSKAMGLNYLLSVFCLVWAADIAAYFGGRAFGRRSWHFCEPLRAKYRRFRGGRPRSACGHLPLRLGRCQTGGKRVPAGQKPY